MTVVLSYDSLKNTLCNKLAGVVKSFKIHMHMACDEKNKIDALLVLELQRI